MTKECENAAAKLKEVYYFLDQMDRIEIGREPSSPEITVDQEFGYMLSALLNACYSVTEHLRRDARLEKKVLEFRRQHPGFYAHGGTGGWRTKAVHFHPVAPIQPTTYIPPPGNNVILRQRENGPYVPPAHDQVNFDDRRALAYYFTDEEGPQNSICDLSAQHVAELASFLQSVCP